MDFDSGLRSRLHEESQWLSIAFCGADCEQSEQSGEQSEAKHEESQWLSIAVCGADCEQSEQSGEQRTKNEIGAMRAL